MYLALKEVYHISVSDYVRTFRYILNYESLFECYFEMNGGHLQRVSGRHHVSQIKMYAYENNRHNNFIIAKITYKKLLSD